MSDCAPPPVPRSALLSLCLYVSLSLSPSLSLSHCLPLQSLSVCFSLSLFLSVCTSACLPVPSPLCPECDQGADVPAMWMYICHSVLACGTRVASRAVSVALLRRFNAWDGFVGWLKQQPALSLPSCVPISVPGRPSPAPVWVRILVRSSTFTSYLCLKTVDSVSSHLDKAKHLTSRVIMTSTC